MNRLDDLFRSIESHEFSAVVNLASDFKTFVRILGAQRPVQDLAASLSDLAARAAVSERVQLLAGARGEEEHEHPSDSALAAYLWLLSEADAGAARIAAAKVAEVPGCWWARKMAQRIVDREGGKPAAKAPSNDRSAGRSGAAPAGDPSSLASMSEPAAPESGG